MIYALLVIVLAGCADTAGRDLFFNHVNRIEEALDQPDWEQIELQANVLEDAYQNNKWKLQLIGDEGEYEGLYNSIQRMIAAIEEEDITNVKMELATIKSFIADIYSL